MVGHSSLNATQTIAYESRYLVPTYTRSDRVFTHGEGSYLFDTAGNRYLDFASGIAVTALGHSDQMWIEAVKDQADQLVHVSNLYHTTPHVQLAQRLVENSFADRVFFCNSGSEANEAALKFARKWVRVAIGVDNKTNIVAFEGSFHGRTMGALSVTARQQYRDPFAPLMPGVSFAPFNDLDAARKAIDSKTCAVIVEPVQGEGGVRVAEPGFLECLRDLCDQHQVILVFDEVQCGLGRTGYLWAHENYAVTPDIMTLAKPLAGGLPIGAVLVVEAVAATMQPGDHGSTFAAGPLVCRAGQAVFDRICPTKFLRTVRANGEYLQDCLRRLQSAGIVDVRGSGLLIGVEFNSAVKPIISAAADKGLLIINAGENVLRLCPPLIVTREQIDRAVEIIRECLG